MSTPTFYALLVLAGLLGAASDAVLNQWAKVGGAGWLVAAYASWLVVATVLGLMFRTKYFGFATAMVVFLLSNVVFAVLADRVVFAGRITRWQWLGIALAVVALVVLEIGKARDVVE